MADVVNFTGVTRLPIPVERVLEQASDASLESVVVVGWDADGELYFASSTPDGGDVLWLFAKAEKALLEVEVDDA